jgi:hypothetical protein
MALVNADDNRQTDIVVVVVMTAAFQTSAKIQLEVKCSSDAQKLSYGLWVSPRMRRAHQVSANELGRKYYKFVGDTHKVQTRTLRVKIPGKCRSLTNKSRGIVSAANDRVGHSVAQMIMRQKQDVHVMARQ